MKRLSIARAWDESAALVKREAGLLFLVAFGLLALPTMIFQALSPEAAPGQTPEPGAWMLLGLPLIVLSILGTLTISVLAVREGGQAADAFARALRRFLPVLGAAVLVAIGAVLCALPFIITMSLMVKSQQAATALVGFIFIVAFLLLWVRLMLMTPIAALEDGGPVAILKRSWALTRGETWPLLGFVVMMVILFVVVTVAVTFIFGSLIILLAGRPDDGNLSSVLLLLLGGVLNAVWGLYFTIMIARIYVQLAGGETSGS